MSLFNEIVFSHLSLMIFYKSSYIELLSVYRSYFQIDIFSIKASSICFYSSLDWKSYLKHLNPTIPLPSLSSFNFSSKDGGGFLKVTSSFSSSLSLSSLRINFLLDLLGWEETEVGAMILGDFLVVSFFFVGFYTSSSFTSSSVFFSLSSISSPLPLVNDKGDSVDSVDLPYFFLNSFTLFLPLLRI